MLSQITESKTVRRVIQGAPLLLAIALCGCDPGKEDKERHEPAPVAPPPTTTEVVSESVDLTGDKPGASGAVKAAPGKQIVLLDEMVPSGPVNRIAHDCYRLTAAMKMNTEKINADLDDGGKQVTRLIRNSDELCKNITEMAALWPADQSFKDQCIGVKRQALIVNDELSHVPRNWAHVRWAFTAMLKGVSQLRMQARDLAEAEPKPTLVVGKDGKTIVVEAAPAPVDPAIAKREELTNKVQRARNQLRKQDEDKKKKEMPTDLDSK